MVLIVAINALVGLPESDITPEPTEGVANQRGEKPRPFRASDIQYNPRQNRDNDTVQIKTENEEKPVDLDRVDDLRYGMDFETVQYLINPAKYKKAGEFRSRAKLTQKFIWTIDRFTTINTTFIDDSLTEWEITRIEMPPAAVFQDPLADSDLKLKLDDGTEVYLLNLEGIIKERILTITNMDSQRYSDMQIAGKSGDDYYVSTVEYLDGKASVSIPLASFSWEGRRFTPFSRVFDSFIIRATRPDGENAWDYMKAYGEIITGN